ncbi:MAG: YdcH family protein [Nitrospirae bacterium]|nr:YdcH family protein [Candidatus Manganitrophaceae bacterium]
MEREDRVIEMLRQKNWQFRHLEKLHGQLDQSLQEMTRRRVLTPQEEIQKKEFQKKKLAAKDEMTTMIRHFQMGEGADLKSARSNPPLSARGH